VETELFNILKAIEITTRTTDAYMYETYRHGEWTKCIAFLLNQGLSVNQIDWIVRSKHMRWADDLEDGETRSEAFENYYLTNRNSIIDDVVF